MRKTAGARPSNRPRPGRPGEPAARSRRPSSRGRPRAGLRPRLQRGGQPGQGAGGSWFGWPPRTCRTSSPLIRSLACHLRPQSAGAKPAQGWKSCSVPVTQAAVDALVVASSRRRLQAALDAGVDGLDRHADPARRPAARPALAGVRSKPQRLSSASTSTASPRGAASSPGSRAAAAARRSWDADGRNDLDQARAVRNQPSSWRRRPGSHQASSWSSPGSGGSDTSVPSARLVTQARDDLLSDGGGGSWRDYRGPPAGSALGPVDLAAARISVSASTGVSRCVASTSSAKARSCACSSIAAPSGVRCKPRRGGRSGGHASPAGRAFQAPDRRPGWAAAGRARRRAGAP